MRARRKLTPWFPASLIPTHVGEYEVRRKGVSRPYPKRTFLLWNGRDWRHTEHSSAGKYVGYHANMNAAEGDVWRGVLK